MRLWQGREQEGGSLEETLYVESSRLDRSVLEKIQEYAHGVEHVYLGAGGVDVTEFDKDCVKELCSLYPVVLETSYENFRNIPSAYYNKIVVRLDLPWYVTPKIVTGSQVLMFENPLENIIDQKCRDTGLYEGDLLLYEE